MKKGFTLTELLAVVMIVSVLTAVAVPQYRRAVQQSKLTQAKAMLRVIYDSSERLAAEKGYRSYVAMYGDVSSASNKGFRKLDMFSQQLPKGCSVTSDSLTMTCSDFIYQIGVKEGSVIVAKKKTAPYSDTEVVFKRGTQELVCVNPSSSTKACEVFGLDAVSWSSL